MARKFGFFQSEAQVIQAIQKLEQAGFVQGDMTVLAKNFEHSRRIEAETDIHVDELRDMAHSESRSFDQPEGLFGVSAATGGYGLAGYGMTPSLGGGGIPLGIPFTFASEEDGRKRVVQALGLDNKETELVCGQVENGAYAIIIETDESKSLLDKEGGPDLSRLGVAEGVFRSCGALRIADGS